MFIPTLETLLTKILNPQVPPFVNPRPLASASFKICRNHLNTSHKSPKSCHDFDQSCHDCSDPTVLTSPYQVNLVRKLLNRVTISQIVSRFFISKTSSLPSQIVTRFLGFLRSQIWSQYSTTSILLTPSKWTKFCLYTSVLALTFMY